MMRVSLFGYNRNQVYNYCDKLDLDNKNEIADLILKIEEQKKYKNSLSENLQRLLDEYESLDSKKDLLDFAKERKFKIQKFINKITEDELEEITLTGMTQIEKYGKEIESKKNQVQHDKEIVYALIKKMLKFYNETEEYEGSQEVEKNEEHFKNEALFKVLPYVNKNTMMDKKNNESISIEKNDILEYEKSKNESKEKNLVSKLNFLEIKNERNKRNQRNKRIKRNKRK